MVDVVPVQVVSPPAQIQKIDDGIARQFSIDKGHGRVAADLPGEELVLRLLAENVRQGPDGRELISQVEEVCGNQQGDGERHRPPASLRALCLRLASHSVPFRIPMTARIVMNGRIGRI